MPDTPPPATAPAPPLTQPVVERLRFAAARAMAYLDDGDVDGAENSFMADTLLQGPDFDRGLAQFDATTIMGALEHGRAAVEAVMADLGLAEGTGWLALIMVDGQLVETDDAPSRDSIAHLLGLPAGQQPRKLPAPNLIGLAVFVRPAAFDIPHTLPPNPVAAAVHASTVGPGGLAMAVRGPMVVSGWRSDVQAQPQRPPQQRHREILSRFHREVHAVLNDQHSGLPRQVEGQIKAFIAAAYRDGGARL